MYVAKVSSKSLTEEPKLPWQRKIPVRLDPAGSPRQYQTPKDKYHHLYFEALEQAAGEIERRSQHSDLHILNKLDILLLNTAREWERNRSNSRGIV